MATFSQVVVLHLQSVPYDPLADFQPVALVAVASSVATVNPSAELLKNWYTFDMTSAPYRGIPPGMSDLIEGRLQVGLLPGPLAIQHVLAGKLRALPCWPASACPTSRLSAGFAAAQVMSWYTIAVRAGTPPSSSGCMARR